MIYVWAFLFSGFVCLIGQIILDNTKLTTGHITALFTVLGALLSFLGIYPCILRYAGGGASTVIMNFGHMLYTSGMEGFKNAGILGIFSDLLCKSSLAIVSAVVFSFIFAIIFKPKD